MAVSRRLGRRVATLVAATLTACALVLAVLSPGVKMTEVDLNDGGVWVTSLKHRLIAHLNFPARLMDSGLRASSGLFDVFQRGEDVQVFDAEAASLTPVDVTTSTLGTPVVFSGLSTTVGGDSVALTDAATGRVWVQKATQLSAFSAEEVEADITDMPGAVSTVGVDGGVHVVSAQVGRVVSLTPKGALSDRSETTLEGIDTDTKVQVAAVGDEPVVWDPNTSNLYLPGGKTQTVEGQSVVLQESGVDSDSVLLASADALIRVPIAGGEPELIPAPASGGVASRPVFHEACAYGAWSTTGAFVRDCAGDSDDVAMEVATLASAGTAVFRTNRDVIVLNDVNTGGLWLPDADMMLVDNWDQIESKLESEENSEEDAVEETTESLLPDRTQANTPPVAVDDEFGVRPGRTTILPVLMNDSDADGDFMTATAVSQPNIGQVSVAREGAALQIDIEEGATGAGSFEYEVSDGRGGTAKARVTLTIRPMELNEAPVQVIVPAVSLAAGRSATVNGLSNWIDPDGDPFYLEDAVGPAGIQVRSHESGSVDITEAGHGVGKDTVALFVSDGIDTGEGRIDVSVTDGANMPPLANADHVVVRAGASATVFPMSNDTDPNGDELRLVQIDQAPTGISATMDGTSGAVTIEGQTAGTYYLSYVITDGPATGPGVIRVDVIDAEAELPPSAEDDLGVLPDGGQTLVDLLANDSDPTGGVLAVQRIDVPAASPLVVALVNHQLVRITAPQGLTAPASFKYTVSNGVATAEATVRVVPKAATSTAAPPEVQDDTLVVRSGDVGAVSVLSNDRSPAGLKMTVSNDLQHEIGADLGTVFISDNIIRVRGGERAGSGRIVYTVHDTMGNVASGVVNLTVVAMDVDTNTAPRPKEITARTVAGRLVTIPVPLNGVDTEGDSVSLVGMGLAPKLGTVRQVGSAFEYTPAPDAKGTDTFTYVVEDALGKQAIGRIRVGVAPRAEINQDPVAVPDVARVRPGTKVSVAVLSNDIDPDGDPLQLDPESLSTEATALEVSARSGRIVATAPQQEGSYVVSYRVKDGVGGTAEGICTIAVTMNAPLQAPIARDDEVTLEQLQASTNGKVDVDVLANDEDPDGDIADVTISSPDSAVSATSGKVSVTLAPQPQTLIYTITDGDGQAASAVIRVPGTEVTRPTLDTRNLPIKVKAGQTVDIAINDYIRSREGRSILLTDESKVVAAIGWDGSPLVKNMTTLTFTSLLDFSGPTSVTVEVTDGADLNDSTGAIATLTLPIEVEPGENRPPTVTPTTVEVAGGEDAIAVPMDVWVKDADGDDPASMKYRISGDAPAGISVSVSGSELKVSAAADAARGEAGTLGLEVTDQDGATTSAVVPIVVTSSTRPLIQTSPAEVTMNAGESVTVDVTQYATNPFADKGPVSIVGAPTAATGGSATASGTQVTINADQGFNGSLVVTYRLQDATKDPAREVQGTITATVRDRPAAPSGTSAVSNSAGSALISWTAGSANGAPITGFTVTDHTQGDTKDCGLVTTCLFEGRKNGVDHTFSVTATNEVGTSDPSNQATVNIDIEPETPAVPTLVAQDRAIDVTWVAPHNEGSAISEYEVSVSPGGPATVSGGQTTHTFTGLVNGAEYTVTVRAKNAKGWSQVSAMSIPVRPYGAPQPPATVSATSSSVGAGEGATDTVTVTWAAANDNGRAIEYYTVSGGGITKEVPGTATSTSLQGVGFSTEKVTFTVTATNDRARAAERTSLTTSTSIWILGKPEAPRITEVTATGEHNQVRISWTPSTGGRGWSTGQLTHQWKTATSGWQPLNGNLISGTGLSNGAGTTVQIRAVGSRDGINAESREASSGTVVPFGPPAKPSVSCHPGGVGWVDCSWSGATDGGRTTQLVLSGNTSETIALSASGQRNFNVGEGGSASLCVKAVQTTPEAGTRTVDGGCASAVAPKHNRYFDGWRGSQLYSPTGNCTSGCRAINISLWEWPPHAHVQCSVNWDGEMQTTTIVLDATGQGDFVPTWSPKGTLVGSSNADANEISCKQGQWSKTPDHYGDGK